MGTIPLPALQIRPPEQQPNALEMFGRVMQIRNAQQQNQMGQVELQNAQQQQKDQQGLTRAINDANGDPDKATKLALSYGVSANGIAKYQDTVAQQRQRTAQNDKDTLEVINKQHDNMRGAIQPLVDLAKQTSNQTQGQPQAQPGQGAGGTNQLMTARSVVASMAEGGGQSSGETVNGIQPQPGAMPGAQPQADPLAAKKQAIWTQQRQAVLSNPKAYGVDPNNPQHMAMLPEQYPGDDAILGTNADLATGHNLVQEAIDKETRNTPEKKAMQGYIDQGMSPQDAYKQVLQDQQDAKPNKPEPAAAAKQAFQGTMAKLSAEFDGALAAANTSPQKVAFLINKSQTLTPAEKNAAMGYMMANPTPASQALSVTLRGESFASSRPVQVLDTKNGNRPVTMNLADMEAGNRVEPGRYLTQSGAVPALNKENLMEDIRGGIQQVRQALSNPDMPDFTTGQKVKIAVAMRHTDPSSAVQSLITSGALGQMSPEQQDYLIAHSVLVEHAMAMRTVLGAGQGSQDLRSAILSTIPGPSTPSKQYGLKQLDIFENTINRLERGIPNVPLKPQAQGGGGNVPPAPQGMITVQIPGHPPGHIPASKRAQFLQDNPGAKVLQ